MHFSPYYWNHYDCDGAVYAVNSYYKENTKSTTTKFAILEMISTDPLEQQTLKKQASYELRAVCKSPKNADQDQKIVLRYFTLEISKKNEKS
jgi:hypothetical protein